MRTPKTYNGEVLKDLVGSPARLLEKKCWLERGCWLDGWGVWGSYQLLGWTQLVPKKSKRPKSCKFYFPSSPGVRIGSALKNSLACSA